MLTLLVLNLRKIYTQTLAQTHTHMHTHTHQVGLTSTSFPREQIGRLLLAGLLSLRQIN